ncbi:mothers against decapentaplegic homolog 7-like [Watersipora subatra]|uniref:mothers against decapentaplegic homolog 7-like n=1 Tax=Watersipora subatra TaxID=2589382 RepID=UPI00355C4F11
MHLDCLGVDCMLRPRKKHLIRELWRESANSHEGTERSSTIGSVEALDIKMKSTLNSILKLLDIDELELLLEAIKSKGRSRSECIHLRHSPTSGSLEDISKQPIAYGRHSSETLISKKSHTDFSYTVCKVWRWKDLASGELLIPLPCCQVPESSSGIDEQVSRSCINPYHWCKVIDVISGLRLSKHQVGLEEDLLPCKVDLDNNTDFTYNDSSNVEWKQDNWCQIAYWELSNRIGQLFPVTPSSIDIFQDIAQGCGVSLAALHKIHAAKSPSIASLRSKIGAGITLSNEGNIVRLYNRSQRDVFVTSYCLNMDKRPGETWRVCKVTSGHALVIYDYTVTRSCHDLSYLLSDGPTDPHSIHLSFMKGWSGSYSRQSILSCECWLEILINKHWFENS